MPFVTITPTCHISLNAEFQQGHANVIFIIFIHTFSNTCNDTEELFVYIKYWQNRYKQKSAKNVRQQCE